MFDDIYIKNQKTDLKDFVQKEYGIDLLKFSEMDQFINVNLRNLIALKIWKNQIAKDSFIGSIQYLDEIISNLNQIAILGMIGFKLPSYMLLRRSLENLMMFIYYKDHQIEFIKREHNNEKKTEYSTTSNLKGYMETYPFALINKDIDEIKIKNLIKILIDSWDKQYRELSNFVHGTSSKYFELNDYLDDIHPSDEMLALIRIQIQKFGSILNALFMIFFRRIYEHLEKAEKSIIRNTIPEEMKIKEYIIDIYNEI